MVQSKVVITFEFTCSGHVAVRKVQLEHRQGGKALGSQSHVTTSLLSFKSFFIDCLFITESSLDVVTCSLVKHVYHHLGCFLPQCVGEACKKIRARLDTYKEETGIVKSSWQELVYSAYSNGVDISERYVYVTSKCFLLQDSIFSNFTYQTYESVLQNTLNARLPVLQSS